ncbi:MAG: UDP-2,4-diacetamido-2,4,6-trideoxy-beta-L-altropyranose hydrolase, partial [Verrucomicrobiota bacterium]
MSSPLSANLVIRADAGLQMGTGHVMRCLALAEPWLQSGSRVTFVSSNLSRPLIERIQNLGIKTASLRALPGSHDDAIELTQIAAEREASWVVVDGYHFGAEYQLALKEAGTKFLFFDDFGHAKNYSADFILNQNLGAAAKLYSHREPQTKLLLGPRYVQLRGEFDHWRNWRRSICPQAKNVLVTLGGSDSENVTLKVIQTLKLIPSHDASVVVGNNNPHRKILAAALQDSPHL